MQTHLSSTSDSGSWTSRKMPILGLSLRPCSCSQCCLIRMFIDVNSYTQLVRCHKSHVNNNLTWSWIKRNVECSNGPAFCVDGSLQLLSLPCLTPSAISAISQLNWLCSSFGFLYNGMKTRSDVISLIVKLVYKDREQGWVKLIRIKLVFLNVYFILMMRRSILLMKINVPR